MRADDLLEEPRFFSSFSCVPRVTQREFSSFLFFVSLPFSFLFCFGSFFVPRCICDTVYDLNSFYVFCLFLFPLCQCSLLAFRFRSVSVSSFSSRGYASWRAFCQISSIFLCRSSHAHALKWRRKMLQFFYWHNARRYSVFLKYIFTILLCVCTYI